MSLHRKFSRKLVGSALILLLCACTPALNWRDVQLESPDGSILKAALPCKPDNATRKQQLGGFQVDLSMMGCSVKDITFTLSRIPLVDPLSATKVLAAWQAAAVVNVKADPAPSSSVAVSGAGAWPQATRVTLTGSATQAHMLWFAKQSRDGLTLYQAALYGKQPSHEAVTTFFESLQLL
jgi:hypothetical protein